MSTQQTKSKAARAKYGRRNTGWLKRVQKALADQRVKRSKESA